MRVRNGFVTNSSSSSFILTFKDDDKWASYDTFREMCMFSNYEDFYRLIENLQNDSANTDKKRALELLFNYYSYEYKFELIDSELHKEDYNTYIEYLDAISNFRESKEFKEKIRKHVEENEDYQNKKKQIEDADLVVNGIVWDTNGGVLNWSIRNGFIEDNFNMNHVITWNIG